MRAALAQLQAAQRRLAERPVDQILAALHRAAQRWRRPDDPLRQEALRKVSESTGLPVIAVGRAIDDVMDRIEGIGVLLDQDLGSRYLLDHFEARAPGIRSRAWGPGLLACIFAGNVPAVPAFDLALCLALKSACLARPSREEPHFASLFAQSLAQEDPQLGQCLAVHHWEYEETAPYEGVGAVVAYGSDKSIEAIRALVPPGIPFVGHGHKIGLAIVAKEAADEENARLLALDVALYDQQGCVSPHMAFIERGGRLTPSEFARACGEALADLAVTMPRGRLTQGEAMALRATRDEAEFTADGLFRSRGDLAWTIVHREAPAFEPSPLNRLLRTYAVDRCEAVEEIAKPYRQYLQTVGFAGADQRRIELASRLGCLGVSRFCPLGQVQQPGALWRHDGRPSAGDLVRWTDLEGS
jgi:acyl-CoA reductase-like NAD-dependent aldehyde dehydrogenase